MMRLGYELRTISVQFLDLLLMNCVSRNVLDCTLGKALFISDGVTVRTKVVMHSGGILFNAEEELFWLSHLLGMGSHASLPVRRG